MAANKKPRKKYRPKGVRLDNLAYIRESFSPVTAHQHIALDLRIKNHEAMTALTKGTATRADWDILVAAFNMTEAFYRLGIGADYKEEVKLGLDALHAVGKRSLTLGGRFVLRSDEMKALNMALELHDAQLDVATLRDMERAIEIVNNEFRLKKMRSVVDCQEKLAQAA